ncbi:MAG: vitamin K epoxide reductase [Chloroflexi bacterium]|nr:vitamin K epoxide reductase [Chloroflexota bacterium]
MKRTFILLVISLFFIPATKVHAQTLLPVAHAVLFYSTTCPHCQYVISQTLPPLTEKYGAQLKIIFVDVSQAYGQTLFIEALKKFGLEEGGVPFLVFDNTYLMGSQDIPEKFPDMLESCLSNGGADWPDIPGLRERYGLDAETPSANAPNQTTTPPAAPIAESVSSFDWQERFLLDPTGNTLAVLVLVGMLGSFAWTFTVFRKAKGISIEDNWGWVIPILCLIGFGIASYLTYVETTQATAVCGPVGDCNTVQQSEYARLFGILPIGVLGMFGYAVIAIAWLVSRCAFARVANLSTILLFAMTVFGTLFSIYLTFLEPFVIGATCAWCLTSAFLMTILMVLMAKPAKLASFKLAHPRTSRRIHARTGLHHD